MLVLVCRNLQSPRIFPLPVCLSSTLTSFLSLRRFHVLFPCKVACLSLVVWVARLAWSLTLSFSTFRYFGPLSLQHTGSVSFWAIADLLAPALIWELHSVSRWSWSLYLIVFDISPARIGMPIFRVKRVSICIYETTYGRYIILEWLKLLAAACYFWLHEEGGGDISMSSQPKYSHPAWLGNRSSEMALLPLPSLAGGVDSLTAGSLRLGTMTACAIIGWWAWTFRRIREIRYQGGCAKTLDTGPKASVASASGSGRQLLTLRAGWSLSAVIFSLSRSFQLPVCLSSAVTSFLSPRRFRSPSFTYFSAVK